MKFNLKTRWGIEHECTLEVNRYADNNHVAIEVWCEDGPYAGLTVNLDCVKNYPENYSYVDTNNFPEAEWMIEELGIGKPRGVGFSGWCAYPLYEFDMDKIEKYTEE